MQTNKKDLHLWSMEAMVLALLTNKPKIAGVLSAFTDHDQTENQNLWPKIDKPVYFSSKNNEWKEWKS